MAVTFSYLVQQVGLLLKNDRTPLGDDLMEVKEIVNDGYLRFLNEHDWSFLSPSTTLAVLADAEETALPSGFEEMLDNFWFAHDAALGRNIIWRTSPENIRRMKAEYANESATPREFAIEPVAFVAATGQRWQAVWFPVPSAALTLHYRYRAAAAALSSDSDYPMGGQRHGQTILAACRTECEVNKGQTSGIYEARYRGSDGDGGLLARSIQRDLNGRTQNLGQNLDNSDGPIRARIRTGDWEYST